MTTHLVTFSDHQMSRSRALCTSSALKHGVDSVAGPHYFDPGIEYRDGFTLEWLKSLPIYEQMGEDWWTQRGCGYWLWKSFLIDLVMSKLRDGDILIYADAGIEFIDNVRYVVDRMRQDKPQDDVWLFGNNWEHAHFCKRDVIDAVWPDPVPELSLPERLEALMDLELRAPAGDRKAGLILNTVDAVIQSEKAAHDVLWHRFGKQAQASVGFFRVSGYSRRFVSEWLQWCKTYRFGHGVHEVADGPVGITGQRYFLINDSPSLLPNHPEFREHRHDQAILTTLVYREGISLHYWPARYNMDRPDGGFVYEKLPEYAKDDYPPLFYHHRRRDHEY